MPSLKNSSVLLALVIMVALSAGVAHANVRVGTTTCVATATPPVVRAEGIAELVGDILLTCTNDDLAPDGTPGVPYLISNVSMSLNVNVTNNRDFSSGEDTTDSALVINSNNTFPGTACSNATVDSSFPPAGCGPSPPDLDVWVPRPQFGNLAADNRLEWNGVNIPVPGGPRNAAVQGDDCIADVPDGCHPDVTSLRLTSVRANASELRVPDQAQFPAAQIQAFLSITGPTIIPITNNTPFVAVPIIGLLVSVEDAVTAGLQCEDQEANLDPDLEDVDDVDGRIRIELTEGFATSFKTQGIPTSLQGNTQWESGYFASGSNNGGGASQATRFIVRFFNVPEGVTLRIPVQEDCGSAPNFLFLRVVDNTDANGAAGTVSTAGPLDGDGNINTVEVDISGGFGVAVYEVMDANPFALESCKIDTFVEWEADTENDLPGVGTAQLSASFAPLSTVVVSSEPAPEPRFVDTGADPQTFLSILRCTTTILFPFVTNQVGFDTGFAVSNTSLDWLGTQPQNGACTLHYHGNTTGGGASPDDQTSTVINAGDRLEWTLSGGNAAQGIAGAPDFQGYIIVVCDFQYGHGFAFITNGFGGIPNLAQGYLGLVIPQDPAGRVPGVPNLHNFGETLGH